MSERPPLDIDSNLSIPRSDLAFTATRAGGPGGQHVNTSSTRVELRWNMEQSRALSEAQRELLRAKLASRLDAEGAVRVVASAHRSQARNREDAEERLAAIVKRALEVPKPRKKTRPGRGAIEARLRAKRERGERKRGRRSPGADD